MRVKQILWIGGTVMTLTLGAVAGLSASSAVAQPSPDSEEAQQAFERMQNLLDQQRRLTELRQSRRERGEAPVQGSSSNQQQQTKKVYKYDADNADPLKGVQKPERVFQNIPSIR